MGVTEQIQYPPEDIYEPPLAGKKNFNHIILWMLYYNKECDWSAFTSKPVEISPSTLSTKLNRLINNNYVEKVSIEIDDRKKNVYRITSSGKERFFQLTHARENKKKLIFPPKVIRKERNYDHWILWMLYNNKSCKWSDFNKEPLSINQSSLSKNLNLLIDGNYIIKDFKNSDYIITSAGKELYHEILQNYDLDSQSILEEEIKRVELITKRTSKFFETYNVDDNEIKFRFINYNLSLPFEKLKSSIDTVDNFYKVLLYLSINHPKNYPNSISSKDFSKKYNISQVILDFHILRIIPKEGKGIYPIKFFTLKAQDNKEYYFNTNDRIEKILKATTEEHIKKFAYLNKLNEENTNKTNGLNKNDTIKAIVEDVCEFLFHEDLKHALKKFLPTYIEHLMYKFESEIKSMDLYTKMDSFVFNQYQQASRSADSNLTYFIDNRILGLLESYLSPEMRKLAKELKPLIKEKEYKYALKKLDSIVRSNKDNFEYIVYKAMVLCCGERPAQAIQLLNSDISNRLDEADENLYLLYYFTLTYSYMAIKKFKEAYSIAQKTVQDFPDSSISYLNEALVLGFNNVFKFLKVDVSDDYAFIDFDKAVSLESDKANKARILRQKSIILDNLERFEEAMENIDLALTYDDNLIELYYTKIYLYQLMQEPDKALELIDQLTKKYPEEYKYLNIKKAHVLKKNKELKKGLELIQGLIKQYPNEHDFLNQLAYWYKYLGMKEEAISTIEKLVNLISDNGNYFDSYGEILMDFKEYDKAIELCEKALEIEPNGWFLFNSYLTIGISHYKLKNYDSAIEWLTKAKEISKTAICCIDTRNYVEKKVTYYMDKIKNKNM